MKYLAPDELAEVQSLANSKRRAPKITKGIIKSSGHASTTYIHQAKARHHLLAFLRPARRVGARRGARVDKELVHVLKRVEAVGAADAEHVDVELVGLGEQQVGLVGHQGEPFDEADAEGAVGDGLGDGEGRGLDVEAALYDLKVGRDGAQVLVRVLVCEVA